MGFLARASSWTQSRRLSVLVMIRCWVRSMRRHCPGILCGTFRGWVLCTPGIWCGGRMIGSIVVAFLATVILVDYASVQELCAGA